MRRLPIGMVHGGCLRMKVGDNGFGLAMNVIPQRSPNPMAVHPLPLPLLDSHLFLSPALDPS